MKGLVSVCMPAFNSEKYIGATIRSLQQQTHSCFELIIVDDGSTDGTAHMVSGFSDARIQFYRQENRGAAAARNRAFEYSKGDYVVFLDADDLVSENYLQTQLALIHGSDSDLAISSWGRFTHDSLMNFMEDRNILKRDLGFHEWIAHYWMQCRHMTPPGRIMMLRKLVDSAGGWNESLSLNDDFEFYTRIFLLSNTLKHNGEAMFYYRSGIGGLSAKKSSKAFYSYYASLEISINKVLDQYPGDRKIQMACANLWQMFIYDVYPEESRLIQLANKEINRLGGASLRIPEGGMTQLMNRVIGWKLTKRLKTWV